MQNGREREGKRKGEMGRYRGQRKEGRGRVREREKIKREVWKKRRMEEKETEETV